MKNKKIQMGVLAVIVALAAFGVWKYQFEQKPAGAATLHSGGIPEVPVNGMVTMLDLGATECIPCKMMAPILAELEKKYDGKAAILFIDVWKHPEQAQKFGIRSIPTQIFYDARGKEMFRHVGFMDKKSIESKLKELSAG
ncbi:thioredoxin family protein [Desulfococcus sp.]|uniref:thioredoxin family protein n=1 Tax=Desulfococcus sp. TaxID=2025834 RepID=UPI00359425F1